MMRFLALYCLLLSASGGEAWTISVAEHDSMVRAGVIFRALLHGEIPASRFDDGPYQLHVEVMQGDTTLSTQEIPLTRLGQLRAGIHLALPIHALANDPVSAVLRCTVANDARNDVQQTDATILTPQLLTQRLVKRHADMSAQFTPLPPLPALYFEQIDELMRQNTSLQVCHDLVMLEKRLAAWTPSTIPNDSLRALRDPVDDSVQPWRLIMPSDRQPRAVAFLLRSYEGPLRKSAWPAANKLIEVAVGAGFALVDIYPAGDSNWTGISERRIALVRSAAQKELKQTDLRFFLIGFKSGATAAIRCAENDPMAWAGIAFHEPDLFESDRQKMVSLRHSQCQPGSRPAHLIGMPIVFSGPESTGFRAWRKRMELATASIRVAADTPDLATWWERIANFPALRPPTQWQIIRPGKYGSVTVMGLSDWSQPGTLTWNTATELRTTGLNSYALSMHEGITVDGTAYRSPERLPAFTKRLGAACGPPSRFGNAPFTVVVGTGESISALHANRRLADAFIAAWSAHSHGRPQQVDDINYQEQGRNLVLIGNTRSNAVLQRLLDDAPANFPRFPLQWDARSVSADDQSWLRSDGRSIALAWPHPADDGRLLVVLDGPPRWLESGMPLFGLPDFAVSGRTTDEDPLIWRDFSITWQ